MTQTLETLTNTRLD